MPNETGPTFGPRKIGQAAFDLQVVKGKKEEHFGPRKFGKKKAAQMKAAVVAAEQRVVEEKAGKPLANDKVVTASIKQIDQGLQENPAVYEEMYALELERAEGPRKGAMRLFMAAEVARDGGPREDRLMEIEGFLKPKK